MAHKLRLLILTCALLAWTTSSVPAAELRVHFALDEGTGTTTVNSISGGPVLSNNIINGATWVPGLIGTGSALSFNAPDQQFVNIGTNLDYAQNVSGVTLSAWVQMPSVSGNRSIFGVSGNTPALASQSRVLIQTVGLVPRSGGRETDGSGFISTSAAAGDALTPNALTLLTTTFNFATNQMIIYKNGVAISTSTPGFGPGTATSNTVSLSGAIGANTNGSGEWFQGIIDDAAMWASSTIGDGVLTGAEVGGLYQLGLQLGYDAGQSNQLFSLHDAQTGSTSVGGLKWSYATGLSGTAGSLSADGNGGWILQLGASTGVIAAVPEPAVGILALLFVAGFASWRRGSRRLASA